MKLAGWLSHSRSKWKCALDRELMNETEMLRQVYNILQRSCGFCVSHYLSALLQLLLHLLGWQVYVDGEVWRQELADANAFDLVVVLHACEPKDVRLRNAYCAFHKSHTFYVILSNWILTRWKQSWAVNTFLLCCYMSVYHTHTPSWCIRVWTWPPGRPCHWRENAPGSRLGLKTQNDHDTDE